MDRKKKKNNNNNNARIVNDAWILHIDKHTYLSRLEKIEMERKKEKGGV